MKTILFKIIRGCFFGVALICSSLALAQSGFLIESINLEVHGGQKINPDAALAHVTLREGMEFDSMLVDQSIRSLYESGIYDFVEARRQTDVAGKKIRLTFVLVTKYRVQSLCFWGNNHFADYKLQKKIQTEAGGLLSELSVKTDAEKIAKFYEEEGFAHATVGYKIDRNEQTGEAAVSFEIHEGQKLRIARIGFSGNCHMPAQDLKKVMESKAWWIFSFFTGTGLLEEDKLQMDLDRIITHYKDCGYLDVEVPESSVHFSYPHCNWVSLCINVDEGQQYRIGDIEIQGNTLYTTDKLRCVLGINSGDIFSPSAVNQAVENIRDFYGEAGYLETGIRAERLPNLDTGDIGLRFLIKESDKFYVETVLLEGNVKTKSNVILRELALAPGDVFDLVRMKASENRLKQTMFFDEVQLSPEAVAVPNRRNLRVTVKERRTGNIQFGVGFSSVEQAVAFVEITQSNFDILGFRHNFQGAGQKMRLRLSVGNKSNQINLNLEEPALFDRQFAVGTNLFRTDAKYVSSLYDELRYGIELYCRKRLVELFVIQPYYKLEVIDIHNVAKGASNVIQSQAGPHTLSVAGFAISRETMDNYLMPTCGSRFKFLVDVAGLGGNIDFFRWEIQGGRWWPTFKTLNQVFSLVGRTGTITPFGGQEVPFYESYYLGGPNNLRGYSYRDVGPRDAAGEVIGGDTYAFASMEYSIQVLPPIRLAAFYDIGFVNAADWDWNPRSYGHDVGFGARILLMGAPVRLDLAYPLRVVNPGQKQGWQFNFSFGTVF